MRGIDGLRVADASVLPVIPNVAGHVHRLRDRLYLAALLPALGPVAAVGKVSGKWALAVMALSRYGNFAWRGLLAYAIGLAAEWPFVSQPDYTRPLVSHLGGADISWVVGWFVAPWST
jgi:purine-cytosine permease-like protein